MPVENNSTASLDSPRRIAIVIGTLETGGAERMALTLLRELLNQGHDAQLLCLGSDISMPIPGSSQEQQAIRGAITSLSNGHAKQSTLKKAAAFPVLHRRLERKIRQQKAELVISFMERANILNLMGNSSTPRIISIRKHLSRALADKSPLKRTLVKLGYHFLLKRASNINFNSSEAADNFQTLFPRHRSTVSVINNFFDPDMLELSRQSPGKKAEELLSGNSIVISGRLLPVKGHKSLIRAFATVVEHIPDSRLIILGDGPLRNELQELVNALGLQQNVTLPGFQKNPYAWVARCRLFVLSSHAEGFPNSLLEAMGLGRPVISTDCHSGPRELLAPNTDYTKKASQVEKAEFGVLTPRLEQPEPDTTHLLTAPEQALADAMVEVLNAPSLLEQYSRQSTLRAKSYTRDAIMQKWISLMKA